VIASDQWIKDRRPITPFVDRPVRESGGKRVISYGLGHYGYDARLGFNFKVFTNRTGFIADPKVEWSEHDFEVLEDRGDPVIIPPNSFALAESLETFDIPREALAIVLGKSTYARCGLVVNVTPLEPEWRGVVTIELSNTTPVPLKVYPGEGIMQVLFLLGQDDRVFNHVGQTVFDTPYSIGEVCRTSYADKGGKYQDQKGIVDPKL
jgi:dCTP deaminase